MSSKNGNEETNDDEKPVFPRTAPFDPRFPNTNATRYCFVMFVDYHRCIRLFDEGHEDCNYFKKTYESICPNYWVEKWQQQLEDGAFPHPLPKKKNEE